MGSYCFGWIWKKVFERFHKFTWGLILLARFGKRYLSVFINLHISLFLLKIQICSKSSANTLHHRYLGEHHVTAVGFRSVILDNNGEIY